jgi:D-lyxose ketol-isomerase
MKRSEINSIIRRADDFIKKHQFHLPPFAYWKPDDWSMKGDEIREIIDRQLGWDITDFGFGNFERIGLCIFTIRNGDPANFEMNSGKLYAEKLLIVEPGQVTPMHFHFRKTEDIINRGGGDIIIQVYNSTPDEQLDLTQDIVVSLDGTSCRVDAGAVLKLKPGMSITIPNYLYHKFWGENSRVMIGEVSLVNDDNTDNRFLEPTGRFPQIDEDEAPLYLLCNEYSKYWSAMEKPTVGFL